MSNVVSWFHRLSRDQRFLLLFLLATFCGFAVGVFSASAAGAQMAQPFGPEQELEVGSVTISMEEKEATARDMRELISMVPMPAPGDGLVLYNFPTVAPNVFGSSSWGGHTQLGQFILRYFPGQGALSPGLNPIAYQPLRAGLYMPRDVMVTSFNSWWGKENPGPPFTAEYGNRLHSALLVVGDGTSFTLSDVNFSFLSSDGVLDFVGNLAGTTFNGTTRVGYSYGPDGIFGTPDDVVYQNNEPDTTLVQAFAYLGPGNATWPGAGDPSAGQQEIDEMVDYLLSENVTITLSHTIFGYTTGETVLLPSIFNDGFETGDASAWSVVAN